MVATVPRVLASLVVAAVLMLGVPMPPFSAVISDDAPQAAAGAPAEDSDSHALASAKPSSTTVALSLPANNGDHRQLVRDLPDVYSPADTLLPEIGGARDYVPLPESVSAPAFAEPFALPLGRAPPLTERV